MKVSTGSIQQLDKTKPRNKCRYWRLCVQVDGKRKQKRFKGSLSDAKAALAEWRNSMDESASDGITLAEYAVRWKDVRAATGSYSNSTLINDKTAVDYICRCPLAAMPLSKITQYDCEIALLWMRDNPTNKKRTCKLSGSTLLQLYKKFRAIFRHAELSGVIASDPTRNLKAPKSDTKEKIALSPLEIELLLNRLDDERISGFILSIYMMLTLGLRRGESLALSYADIQDGIAHVHCAIDPVTNTLSNTKTSAGTRDLPMPQRLVHKLHEWADFRDSWGIADAPVIACTPQGRVMTASAIECWWTSNRDRLGCAGLTLHELRHSNLSMMARVMPSAFDLQRWAGWSSINPARTYVHRDMDALTAAAASVLPARAENAPV